MEALGQPYGLFWDLLPACVAFFGRAVIRSAIDRPNIFGACFHCSRNASSDTKGGKPLFKLRFEVCFCMDELLTPNRVNEVEAPH